MKKTIVSLLTILALLVASFPIAVQKANADYYCIDLYCNPNASNAQVGGSPKGAKVLRTIRRSNITADFNNIKATRPGYTFLGWYTASGVRLCPSNVSSHDKETVYAHWWGFTSSGQGVLPAQGGTTSVNVNGGKATLRLISVTRKSGSSGTSWISISISGSNVYAKASENRTNTERSVLVTIEDQSGGSFSFTVKQNPAEIIESIGINRIFETATANSPKYANIFEAGERKYDYNMGYVKWFHLCCTESAMMDLLNRRLARDGLLKTNYYFDVRDILEGISQKSDKREQGTRYNASRVYTESYNEGKWTKLYKPGWDGVYGEMVNFGPGDSTTSYYENQYGSQYGAKKYTVRYEYGAQTVDYLKKLLISHPEGIFVYSDLGGVHAMVIVGYVNGKFRYIDSAEGKGILEYKDTTFVKGHKKDASTETTSFLSCMKCIAYVE